MRPAWAFARTCESSEGEGGLTPDTGIGYGYVMNKLGFHLVSDPRELALRNALFHEVLGTRPQA
ncbi:hypothetical protein BST25_15040 [Mycobacterium heidelbergense]|uniref:Uncharacterized protein n=1 Tax=Mycobacterium heidelbergense TaxID=53376 RepID=A0A1X0DIP7_MYCHE|nr:hypothetical protein BST25_15040 [Mycobacterium heidelbergense]